MSGPPIVVNPSIHATSGLAELFLPGKNFESMTMYLARSE